MGTHLQRLKSNLQIFPMAQGSMKVKAKKPKGIKEKSRIKSKKSAKQLKKGKLSIAPKKKNLIAAAQLQKSLRKTMGKNLEEHVISEAKAKGTSLHLLSKGPQETKT